MQALTRGAQELDATLSRIELSEANSGVTVLGRIDQTFMATRLSRVAGEIEEIHREAQAALGNGRHEPQPGKRQRQVS
jgi:hypothetical protein